MLYVILHLFSIKEILGACARGLCRKRQSESQGMQRWWRIWGMKGDTWEEKFYLSSSKFTESQLVGKCQNHLYPCPNLSLMPSCLSHKDSPCIYSSAQLQGSSAVITGSLESACPHLHGGVALKSISLVWLFLLDELPQGIFFYFQQRFAWLGLAITLFSSSDWNLGFGR